MIPFIPAIVVGSGLYYGYGEFKKWRANTPERKAVYQKAMNSPTDPNELRALAAQFEQAGLKKQADMLRKRAALREAPNEIKAARQAAFKKAMNSNDPNAIDVMADAHEKVGAEGAAQALRMQAATLRSVKEAK